MKWVKDASKVLIKFTRKKKKVPLKVGGQTCVRQHGLSSQWVSSSGAAEHHASITHSSPWVVSSYLHLQYVSPNRGLDFCGKRVSPCHRLCAFAGVRSGFLPFDNQLARAKFLPSVHFPELCCHGWSNILSTASPERLSSALYIWLLKCCLQHPLITVQNYAFFPHWLLLVCCWDYVFWSNS